MSKARITKPTQEWNTINWAKVQRKVFKLQKKIFQAVRSGNKVKAKKLQKLLLKSHYAKLLAVRKVTQDNQGRKTAGIDGIKALRPNQRINLAYELNVKGYRAKALRRIWIPKPGRDEKRPLGIPTIKDRAMQALVKSALEPYWEAQFEGTSYGFRPGRSTHDAIGRIYISINQKIGGKYVLDADISKCFDKINHDYLLSKIDCPSCMKQLIKKWLKCGVIDNGVFEETDSGTPQGGTISPLLANIALHGMINEVERKFPETIYKNGKQIFNYRPKIIRYADDFVVLHNELEIIRQCKSLISKWLTQAGLELKPEKTSIRHTLKSIEKDGKTIGTGLNFLGFQIRSYPVGKHHSGKNGNKEILGSKTLIKPSNEAIKAHHEKIKKVIKNHKKTSQEALILRLSPVIKGWSNYYQTVASKETFSSEDHILWNMLRAWAISRVKKGSTKKKLRKYFSYGNNGIWTFRTKEMQLYYHSETEIKRHQLVKAEASPYDGNWTYWSKRRGNYPETPTRVAKLLKKQKGKCNFCGQHFTPDDLVDIDHIIPKAQGGKDTYKNLQALHRHCHEVKSRNDSTYHRSDNGYEWKDDVLTVPMTKG
ncbi:group II intron reverse transcriptase/maturase [Crocosphaera chwakensis]|uniref:RNA-directed DNA polymerase n=1 Tax=Crocosphaera chwakensis CCY0110 TaxID=391612 RepID=A3IWS5_9CHRO|nr:group II intron reverse transcriptase/maturase [Crocosphaera chwakensis]EAZ89080.1 RNA-directed DNA polymerase [Crocosphaera chwakensis CCY0110]